MTRERTPTTSHIEQALPWLKLQLAADEIEFALLRPVKRLVGIEEVGTRVDHFRIEEQCKEFVAGVVVVANG